MHTCSGNCSGTQTWSTNKCSNLHTVTGEMESEGPDEPLEGIKKAKSGTRIKVLEVLDGYYNRVPIKLPPWTEPTKKWFWGDFWGFGV